MVSAGCGLALSIYSADSLPTGSLEGIRRRFQVSDCTGSNQYDEIYCSFKIEIFKRFTQDIKKHKKERNWTPMRSEVPAEGFRPILGCVRPKNALEIKIFKKLKKLKKHPQGFTQGIRKHKKITQSRPFQMRHEGFGPNIRPKMSRIWPKNKNIADIQKVTLRICPSYKKTQKEKHLSNHAFSSVAQRFWTKF